MLERYYIEKEKQEKLLSRKNVKSDFYNGIYDRYEHPVLTREHIPLTWRYDLNPKTNPYFMERLGINAVMNSGAPSSDASFHALQYTLSVFYLFQLRGHRSRLRSVLSSRRNPSATDKRFEYPGLPILSD